MPKPILNEKDIVNITELYEKGNSQIDIANIYCVNPQLICRFMKKHNIKARSSKEMGKSTISLNNEQIDKIWCLYNNGLNRDEIAIKIDISPWAVRKIIQGKCRAKGETKKFIHEKNTVPLTYEQEQLILGSLLGDASLIFTSKNGNAQYAFQVGHCVEQKQFLEYKCNVLQTKIRSYIKDETSYSAGKEFFITAYYNKYELEKIYNLCFVNKIKTVSVDWINKINAMAIAIWFMDDGTSSFTKNSSILVRFSTLSFPKKQLKLLQNRLNEFNINSTLQKHSDGEGYVIAIKQDSINKLMDLVEPFVVPCMNYKIKRRLNEPKY